MVSTSRVKKRRARLTVYEDYCWVHAFCFYTDNSYTGLQADKRAWRDMCREFPRLRGFDGCLP